MRKQWLILTAAAALVMTACGGSSVPATSAAAAKTETKAETKEETKAAEAETVAPDADFVATWHYPDTPYFLELDEAHRFKVFHFDGTEQSAGDWELNGDCVTLTEDGGNHLTDLSFNADGDLLDADRDAVLWLQDVPKVRIADAKEFEGVWKYIAYPLWINIYQPDECEFIDYSGESSGALECKFIDNKMIIYTESGYEDTVLLFTEDGDLLTSDMQALEKAELPTDFSSYEEDGRGGEEGSYYDAIPYFGCWKYENYDLWIYVGEDGGVEYIYNNGDAEMTQWYPGGDCLYLLNPWGGNDSSLAFVDEYTLMDENGDRLYKELPPFARYQ